MKPDQHIASLLEQHDCVIIPDFGGFVANYAKARINPVNQRFDPPYRKISFNKLLVHNDGLLAAYVAQKEQVKYEDALRNIRDYVVVLKEEVEAKGKVTFDRVGVLYVQEDGTFRFEQMRDVQLWSGAFGLEAFFAQPIERKAGMAITVEPKAAAVQQERVIAVTSEKEPAPTEEPKVITMEHAAGPDTRRRRGLVVMARAAAIALPILGYLGWVAFGTPLLRDPGHFRYSDLNPFTDKICPEYQVRAQPFIPNALEQIVPVEETLGQEPFLVVYEEHDPDKTLVVRLSEPKEADSPVAVSEDLHYHVIGGCFTQIENAEALVAWHREQGRNAAIVDQHGALFRVSISSFATKKEAMQSLTSLRNDIPAAWILHK